MAFRSSSPACAIIRAKAPHLTKPRRGRLLTSAAQPLIWHLLWLINAIHLVTKGAFFYIKVSGVKWYPEGQESSATVMVSIFRMSGQEKWVITAISSVHTWARERFLSSQPPPRSGHFPHMDKRLAAKCVESLPWSNDINTRIIVSDLYCSRFICLRPQQSLCAGAETYRSNRPSITAPSMDAMRGEMGCQWQWVLGEGASVHCNGINCECCDVPTCTVSLILNQQVLLFLTSGLLQLALVAVILAVGAAHLQENQS